MTQGLTARQSQRMLHFLNRSRELLTHERDVRLKLGETEGAAEIARELKAVGQMIAEVTPIIWPKPDVPPGLQDRNGNTR